MSRVSSQTPQTDPRPVHDWRSELEQFSDRWDPLLVREVRRMLKGRAFGSSFVILVLACLLMCYYLVSTSGASLRYQEYGAEFCRTFLNLLGFPLMFVVPLAQFSAISEERTSTALEMLSITTIKTEHLVSGYFRCGLVHAGLYYSVLVPFLSFSYLLGGIGLGQITVALLVLFVIGLTCQLWGLMLGACVRGDISRVVCMLFLVLGSVFGYSIMLAMNQFVLLTSDPIGLLSGLGCLAFFTLPALAIMFGIARGQLQIVDPMVKPYRIKLDEDGNVEKFLPRYTYQGHTVDSPEWRNPSLADRSSDKTNP